MSKSNTQKSHTKCPKPFNRSYSGPFDLKKERQRALKDWEEINKILCNSKSCHRKLRRNEPDLSFYDKHTPATTIFTTQSSENFWKKVGKILNPWTWIFWIKVSFIKFKVWFINFYRAKRWHKEKFAWSKEKEHQKKALELKDKNSSLFKSDEFLDKRHEGRISSATIKIFEQLRRESINSISLDGDPQSVASEKTRCTHVLCKLYLGKNAPCYGRMSRSDMAHSTSIGTIHTLPTIDFSKIERSRPGLFRKRSSGLSQISKMTNNISRMNSGRKQNEKNQISNGEEENMHDLLENKASHHTNRPVRTRRNRTECEDHIRMCEFSNVVSEKNMSFKDVFDTVMSFDSNKKPNGHMDKFQDNLKKGRVLIDGKEYVTGRAKLFSAPKVRVHKRNSAK